MNTYRFWDIKRLTSFRSATRINILEVGIELILMGFRLIIFLMGTLSFYVPGIIVFMVVDYLTDNTLLAAILYVAIVILSIVVFFFLEGAMLNKKRLYQNDYTLKNINFLFKFIGPLLASVLVVLIVYQKIDMPIWISLASWAVLTIILTSISMAVLKPVKRVEKRYLKLFFEYGKTF